MCKNKVLKESLRSLTKSTYSLSDKELHLEDGYRNDNLQISIALSKLDSRIAEFPEFGVCVGLISQDEKISGLFGKLVGTYSARATIRDAETCLLGFVKQIFLESKDYSDDVFNEKYLSFEALFYSDDLSFQDTARLYNFSFDKNELMLGKGVSIKVAENPVGQQEDQTEGLYRPHVLFHASSYVLERSYQSKKIVGEITDQDETKVTSELSETSELFDMAINSLRILKSSAVYRDHRVKTKNLTFHPFAPISIRWSMFENVAVGEKCNIAANEIIAVSDIFDFLSRETDSRFNVALRRLSSAIERQNPEDKLIDYMIGLEALYLPDGSAELSFRLSMRAAFLLASGVERKDVFNFVRRMYDVRSSIVHGNKYELNADDIKKLEDLLRKSLLLWINNKDNFSITEKSNSGKVKKEGKLDTIWFDL